MDDFSTYRKPRSKDSPRTQSMNIERVFVYAGLASITMLFLTLSVVLLYSRLIDGSTVFHVPVIFHPNTVIIIVSSLTLGYAIKNLQQHNDREYLHGLLATFVLGMLFLVFQYIGWKEILLNGSIKDNKGNAFLMMLSVVHALHILGGVGLLGYSLYRAWRRESDPVDQLIFSTDNNRVERIKLLGLYWHFVDGLWVYLYVFFVVNSLV